MEEKSIDVNTPADSSTVAAAESAVSHDAMSDSSSEQTATQQDGKAEGTMADVILDQFKKSTASETSTEGEAEKGSGSETEQDAEGKVSAEKAEEGAVEKEDDSAEKETEDRGPVPYERFQEVVHARQQVEQTLNEAKPKVESYERIATYCEQAGITPEQFNQALEFQALLNTNPTEALKRLTPIVDQLRGLSGDALSPDLQKAVDDGDITLAYAKRLAQAEAQKKYTEQNSQTQQQKLVAEQQRMFQQSLATAAQSWEQAKRKADPDYMPKGDSNASDGKWELCRYVFKSMLHDMDERGNLVNPVKTPQDMTALMERAYKQVSMATANRLSRPPTRKPLSSQNSSKVNHKSVEDAGSMTEAIQIALAQRG